MLKPVLFPALILGLVLAPALSNAWTPFPYPPTYGYPWSERGFPSGMGGYAQNQRKYNTSTGPAEFRVARDADQQAYYLTIDLNDMPPQDVQVRTEGRWIVVGTDRSQETTHADSDAFDQGGYYVRSYSMSSRRMARRFNLPPDADPEAMTRKDSENQVRITIPRRQSP